jgi:hypothetical protein
VEEQRRKQAEAIEQLKNQLEELESYAYLSGDSAPPSKLLLERQRLVMEQLRDRFLFYILSLMHGNNSRNFLQYGRANM